MEIGAVNQNFRVSGYWLLSAFSFDALRSSPAQSCPRMIQFLKYAALCGHRCNVLLCVTGFGQTKSFPVVRAENMQLVMIFPKSGLSFGVKKQCRWPLCLCHNSAAVDKTRSFGFVPPTIVVKDRLDVYP